jgi:hypothetical protein
VSSISKKLKNQVATQFCPCYTIEKYKMDKNCNHIRDNKRVELQESYRLIQRYSLLFKNKFYLKLNKRGKDMDSFLRQDSREQQSLQILPVMDSQSGQSIQNSSQKRKRSVLKNGMESIVHCADKLPLPKCFECQDFLSSARIHMCLECIHVCCFQHLPSDHEHSFFMDFAHLSVYCLKCKDYIHDHQFDQLIKQEKYNLNYCISRIRDPLAPTRYYPLKRSNAKDLIEISKSSTVLECSGILRLTLA